MSKGKEYNAVSQNNLKSKLNMSKEAFTDSLKSFDLFFYTYTPLKFKGSNKYRTALGGIMTICVSVFMAFYIPEKILDSKDFTFVGMHDVYHDLSETIGPVSG